MAQSAAGPGELTIDELARKAGTTTRNIRAHQSRGLLSPPRLVGRVGYYSQEHLDRLLQIAKLQERGFSLASIQDLLDAQEKGIGLTEVLGLEVELSRPWMEESPGFVTEAELVADFPEIADDPGLIKQGTELGVMEPANGGFRVPSPRLYKVGVELVRAGFPLEVVFDMGAALKADMTTVAQRFIEDFTRHIWEPAFSGKYTSAEITKLTETIQRIRPLGAESAQIFLAQAMDDLVGQALQQPAPWSNPGEDESSP
ncbi:MAG TPA: MerR family transcriptional regulator [Actinomycetota bacterium]|jgi:DNA-binding transcriptional MerR regulator/putative lipoic acid-binding regulatory protein